jgi:hypothetical protein
MSNIFFMNVWSNLRPNRSKRVDAVTAINRRFRWLLPLGTQQLFIAVINSLALAALVMIVTQLLLGGSAPIQTVGLASILVVLISFEVHVIYARLKYDRAIKNVTTADGSRATWDYGVTKKSN